MTGALRPLGRVDRGPHRPDSGYELLKQESATGGRLPPADGSLDRAVARDPQPGTPPLRPGRGDRVDRGVEVHRDRGSADQDVLREQPLHELDELVAQRTDA